MSDKKDYGCLPVLVLMYCIGGATMGWLFAMLQLLD